MLNKYFKNILVLALVINFAQSTLAASSQDLQLVTCRGDNNQVITLSFAMTESGADVYKIKTNNLTRGEGAETISGPIVINGQETCFSTPSRIAFSSRYGEMVMITAPEPFGTILEGVGSSMNVVITVEDLKTNSKCTRVK